MTSGDAGVVQATSVATGASDPSETGETERHVFLAGLAHDFRQMLAVVLGTTQLAERRMVAGVSSDAVIAALRSIGVAANQMVLLIAELEGRALERRPVDLGAMAQKVAAQHHGISECHRLLVIVEDATCGPIIGQWDACKLERALDNLIGNAFKFSPAGGSVTIEVGREAGSMVGAGVAVVRVRDEGVGIPVHDVPYVFERLRRAENVVTAIPGTGVGLAVVKQIVEQHGGTAQVTSELGSGSTFTIRLPLS